jgi:hypothetical protein
MNKIPHSLPAHNVLQTHTENTARFRPQGITDLTWFHKETHGLSSTQHEKTQDSIFHGCLTYTVFEMTNSFNILARKYEGKRPHGWPKSRWEDIQCDSKLLSGFPWPIIFKPEKKIKARMLKLFSILRY